MPKVDERIIPIRKVTTRKPRLFENPIGAIDLVFNCPFEEVNNCKYSYTYGGNLYGIDVSQIESAINNDLFPIVIVRDYEVIIRLKEDYPAALAIYIHSAYTGEELKKILVEQGRQDLDIEERRQRERDNFSDYMKYLDKKLFDHYVFNYYDDSLISQMKFFLSQHKGWDLI